MRTVALHRIVPFLLFLILTCCASPEAEPGAISERDSLGIRIIETTLPRAASLPEWQVSPEPILSVGELEGEDPYLFEAVIAALRTSDGGVVVGNDGVDKDLRFFDSEGHHVRTVGRVGSGPGEFRSLDAVIRYRGDSLAVWDRRLHRVSVFDGTGALGRLIDLSHLPDPSAIEPIFGLPDGRLLSVPEGLSYRTLNFNNGWHWAVIAAVAEEGDSVVTMAELPRFRINLDSRGLPVEVLLHGPGIPIVAGSGFGWCRTDEGEVQLFGPSGETTSLIRIRDPKIPLDQEFLNRQLAAMEARGREVDYIARQRRRFDEGPLAEFLPILRWVYGTQDGIWLQPFQSDPLKEREFLVFDSDLGWLAKIEVPEALAVRDITPDFLVLTATDELGVSRVVVHRILKPLQDTEVTG